MNIVFYFIGKDIPEYFKYFIGSIRKYMPKARIIQATAFNTPQVPGVDEVSRIVPSYPWKEENISIIGYECLSNISYKEVLFADPDMLFNDNVEGLFDGDFDVTVASRPDYSGMKLWYCKKYPYNSMMIVKNPQFWKDCFQLLQNMKLRWENNMIAVRDTIDSGKYRVRHLDGNIYNYLPRRLYNYNKDIKVFHFKGYSKDLMKSFYDEYWGVNMKLSIIVPVLNSHEIVRRQLLHYQKMNLPDDVEIIFMDDGSDPPIVDSVGVKNLRIVSTNDTREWTWAVARNLGAKIAKGNYFLMTDLDYILPKEAIEDARNFTSDKMRFRREFGVLFPDGSFTQNLEVLEQYGLPKERIENKGVKLPPHPNNFVMKKEVYWEIGGYVEDRIGMPYPQGEDRKFKRDWVKAVTDGKFKDSDYRPTIYMFPNGQFCGDVDYNPFNLFHNLSRKTDQNPFMVRTAQKVEVVAPPKKETKLSTLSVIIPARNEEFLDRTINDILDKAEVDTEVIAILDGYWPDPPINDREKVVLIHHTTAVGQRAATNEGARLSKSDYVMKLDAHCIVDQGFDRKLIEPYLDGRLDRTATTIPRMYNLHAFDWECDSCKNRTYQGPKPDKCAKCNGVEFHREMVWQPRFNRMTESWMFDKDMHFQYWDKYRHRPEFKGDIVDVMSSIGACFFMPRDRFFEIEGLDEKHGSWGQFGVEIACKSWLSGGRHVVNKLTWFSHMFRTQRDFSFPYQISGNDQDRARKYSRDLWLNNKWEKQKYPVEWLVTKFAPVPSWT